MNLDILQASCSQFDGYVESSRKHKVSHHSHKNSKQSVSTEYSMLPNTTNVTLIARLKKPIISQRLGGTRNGSADLRKVNTGSISRGEAVK